MLSAERRREVRANENDQKEAVKGTHVPVRASPTDRLVLNKCVRNQRAQKADNSHEVEKTDSVQSPLVRDDFLDTSVRHLLKPTSNTKDDSTCNHLIDTLASRTHDRSDEGNAGAKDDEIASSKNIRQAASYRNDDRGTELP